MSTPLTLAQLAGLTELEARAVRNAYIDRAGMDPARRNRAHPLAVGGIVMIYSRGAYRWAVIERIGPRRVTTVYTTPGALQAAARWGSKPNMTRKVLKAADVFEPASPGARP